MSDHVCFNRILALAASLAAACLLLAACGSPTAVSGPPSNPNTHGYPTYSPAPASTATPVPQVSNDCSPAPCASYDNSVTLSAQLANDNLPPGEFDQVQNGTYYVQVNVSLVNGSTQPVDFNPFDFKLQTVAGVQVSEAFMSAAACQSWQAVTLVPGGRAGPESLCFNPAGNPGDKLILVWQLESITATPASIPLN